MIRNLLLIASMCLLSTIAVAQTETKDADIAASAIVTAAVYCPSNTVSDAMVSSAIAYIATSQNLTINQAVVFSALVADKVWAEIPVDKEATFCQVVSQATGHSIRG